MKTFWTTLAFAVAFLLLTSDRFAAQVLDICGCATVPGLQPFDSNNPATFPPGTSDNGSTLSFTLPPDGIFKFSSVRIVNRQVNFARNNANTPVTFLVAGDFQMLSPGCCYDIGISGSDGSSGTGSFAGIGGQSGPGGFRGGDGAGQAINGAAIGGPGFGPGGGAAGTVTPFTSGVGGTFFGLPELVPLVGGAGGGGGSSTSSGSTNCTGGGGGGGGGALLIAANGTITITPGARVFSDGGSAGGSGNGACASAGGGGSGGAIRLVAKTFAGGGELYARGNNGGTAGRIRLESIDSSSQTAYSTQPAAQRVVGPTPLVNPIAPTVTITSVGGSAVPAVPLGTFGSIDVVLPSPGATPVAISTTGVPSGTTVEVTVKPRLGGQAVVQTAPLTACNAAGACDTAATFNLAAGAYVVEARATFQIQ